MALEDKTKDFAARLDRRVAAHQAQQQRDRDELAALYRRSDRDQQAQVDRRRAVDAAPALDWPASGQHARRPLPAREVVISHAALLQRLDQLMWAVFDLGRAFPGQPLSRYSVVYCEALEEFFAPLVAELDISETARAEGLRELVEAAERRAREGNGGTLGVNLPGRGCYINGWLFGFMGGQSASGALQDPQVFPRILATVCHEKLGHGFIAELTAVGREKTALGLWRFDLARRFSLRTVDSPRSALLARKDELLYHVSKFTEEGWATWVDEYMLWQAAQNGLVDAAAAPKPGAQYTLQQVGQVLSAVHRRAPEFRDVVQRMDEAIRVLLVSPDPPEDLSLLFSAVRTWQQEAQLLDDAFAQMTGQPALYVLGYLLLRRLEVRLGWRNLPYAVAIAANVEYDLDNSSVTDLERLVASDPRLNVDARLALLSCLELQPGQGMSDLARQARERLSLAVPKGW
ncbi:MAG: hypothetical protein JW900_03730 [Anaerolineae bacterium]|nr:hypothetical protein [Anaerolineae bacterium]